MAILRDTMMLVALHNFLRHFQQKQHPLYYTVDAHRQGFQAILTSIDEAFAHTRAAIDMVKGEDLKGIYQTYYDEIIRKKIN